MVEADESLASQLSYRVFTSEDLAECVEYYERLDSRSPYHDPRYLNILAGNFEYEEEQVECFILEDDEGEFVYYPYLKRPLTTLDFKAPDVDLGSHSDIVSSWYYGGPLLSPGAEALAHHFPDVFTRHCEESGIVSEFLRLDPNIGNHESFPGLEPEFNRETVTVDLTRSDEEIWDDFESRNQRAIRQGQETDIEVTPTRDPEQCRAFYDIYCSAMDAKEASQHYRFSLNFFEKLVLDNPDLATLLVATYENRVIGGFVAVHDDTIGHHYLSASEPEYWDMRVNNLLFYSIVMHMKKTGRDLFDFQGGRPGVFKFKKGFSSSRERFFISRKIHMPEVYRRLVRAAEEAGIDTAKSYFPAYRVEQSN